MWGRRLSPARLLATWFGCGYSKFAPGTVGTLGALPLVYVLHTFGLVVYWAGTALVTLAGVWASGRVAVELGVEDPQSVVIDEVSGTLIAVGLASGLAFRESFLLFGIAVLAFRLFDIWKPGPIDSIQSLPKGWGIMADDVLAGIAAGMVAQVAGAFL
jgi:phosphatidylglycerophosphatase A